MPIVSTETPFTLTSFHEGVNISRIATRVIHEINNNGYATKFEAESPTGG